MPRPLLPLLILLGLLAGCFALGGSRFDPPYPGEIVVARMEKPKLDRVLNMDEWSQAQRLEGEFVIDDGTRATGHYPFQLWLGADDRWLYAAVLLTPIGPNPWSNYDLRNVSVRPDTVEFFFVNGYDGELRIPADWLIFYNMRNQGSETRGGYWDGGDWQLQNEDGAEWKGDEPVKGAWGRGGYDNESLFWEIALPRSPTVKEFDGLDLRHPSTFRMGLVFSRQGGISPDARGENLKAPHDAYPGDGYTPNNYFDPETWLRVRLPF